MPIRGPEHGANLSPTTGTYIYDVETWTEVGYLDTPVFVTAVAWSPDGRYLALARWSTGVQVWDVDRAQVACILPTGGRALDWSPDGRQLAVSGEQRLQVWAVPEASLIYSLDHIVAALTWNPAGDRLAAGDEQGRVHFVTVLGEEVEVQDLRAEFPESPFSISSLSWNGENVLAIGGQMVHGIDGLMLWDPGQATLRTLRLPGIENPIHGGTTRRDYVDFDINALEWGPDGHLLAMDADGWRFLWDEEEDAWYVLGVDEPDDRTQHRRTLSWDPRGTFVATGGDRTAGIWGVDEARQHPWHFSGDGAELDQFESEALASRAHTVDLGEPLHAQYLSWSPDGELLAIAEDYHGKVSVWDRYGQRIQVLVEGGSNCDNRVRPVWSPDGRYLAYRFFCPLDHLDQVRVWERDSAVTQQILERGEGFGISPGGSGLAWSMDGRTLAAVAPGSDVALWDTGAWNEVGVLEAPEGTQGTDSLCVAFAADGVLAVGYSDGMILVWDVGNREVTRTVRGKTEETYPSIVRWSPDGKRLIFNERDGVRIWNTGGEGSAYTVDNVVIGSDVAWSPDGRTLAVLVERQVNLWNTGSWTLSQSIDVCLAVGVSSADWSPDGETLAFSCGDGTVHLWSVP